MVAHACNLSTQEADTGGLPGAQRQPKLHSASRVSLDDSEVLSQTINKKTNEKPSDINEKEI